MNKLFKLLIATETHIDKAVSDLTFHSTQRKLLEQTVKQYREHERQNPLGGTLTMFYLIINAWGRKQDEQVERTASFCHLFLLALDLLDDVQDDDLKGKLHEEAGAAIASNNAAALFFLAMGEFHKALALEQDFSKRAALLEVFNRISVRIAAGQHLDLLGQKGALTPEEVLKMNQAKTSMFGLIVECASLLSGCDLDSIDHYRKVGEQMALLIQIRDDLRDIFGKSISPDLKAGKITYPVSCYLQSASEKQIIHFKDLVNKLPDSMNEVRKTLHQSGAVKLCAEAMEACRIEIHQNIAAIKQVAAEHRMILDMADGVAETIYMPPPLKITAHFWRPEGEYHEMVRSELKSFVQRMSHLGLPEAPSLKPWFRPQWMYDAKRRVIFYPDIEGQADDTLTFQAALLGVDGLEQAAQIMREQVPVVLAHEMFHFWRDASGRLTDDHWHEEWAANRLAVTYLRHYVPEALKNSVGLADSIVNRFPDAINSQATAILDRSVKRSENTKGYELDMAGIALVEIEMFRRLAQHEELFTNVVSDLLVHQG